ncbi:hypothetical protein [Acidovorax sp. Leaf84]|uniref:hypothetical protein n=1 Tax=unclassified Acidovorax TaxID=2684926 RepID=UPI000A49464B|nr:hypothetical protein [Acidovorax sp. Leaf84]
MPVSPPHLSSPSRRGGCFAWVAPWLACLALAGCGPDLQGSPQPPKEFGPVQSAWFGCPSMQGVYAWPPVAGAYAQGRIASNRRPWEGGLPIHINGPEMQIWVQQAGGETTLRTRTINRARNVRSPLTRQWGLATYGGAETSCSSGMLDVALRDIPVASTDYGGNSARRGFRLALMKDGSLAVGIRTVSTGHKGSYFSWGGQSFGSYDAPDIEHWSWSQLARTGPGDKEPAVVDAYVPGATTP